MKGITSLKIAAAVTASLGLAVGFGGAGIASATPFSSYHHHNLPTAVVGSGNVSVSNDTSIHLANNNPQNVVTGSATVEAKSYSSGFHHHNSGSTAGTATATSGAAANVSTTSATVSVHNPSATPADMPAVPQGVNVFHSGNTSTDNETRICVTNTNVQTATSGDATVNGNVNAGSATSGDASNSSTSSFTVSVSN